MENLEFTGAKDLLDIRRDLEIALAKLDHDDRAFVGANMIRMGMTHILRQVSACESDDGESDEFLIGRKGDTAAELPESDLVKMLKMMIGDFSLYDYGVSSWGQWSEEIGAIRESLRSIEGSIRIKQL